MSKLKGKCILVAQEKGHVTETLKKGDEYLFTKVYVEKINQHGYVIINPADPANPIRMKEETFNLFFEEINDEDDKQVQQEEKGTEKVVENKKPEKEEAVEEKKDKAAPENDAGKERKDFLIKGPTPEISTPIFTGIEVIMENMDMIENIMFTPNVDKNLTVTVKIKPDLAFSVTGVPEKIVGNMPSMLNELFSVKGKVQALNELIERRIELEKKKELESKKEDAKNKASTAKKENVKKKTSTDKKEEPKELFDKNEKAEDTKAEDTPKDEAKDVELFDADNKEDWS